MRNQTVVKGIKDVWILKYHVIIPVIVTAVGACVC